MIPCEFWVGNQHMTFLQYTPDHTQMVAPGSHRKWSFLFRSAPFIYSRTSLHLLLWLALCEGHVYCLWPLPCILLVCTTLVSVLFVATILLVCTTLVCVLFVTTTTYTISVYYFRMYPVCGHYHIYY